MTSVADSKGNWILISTSFNGDLDFARVDWKQNAFASYERVRRESYSTLWVRSVTRDAADNVYVLTQTGARDEAVPTLCRLPAEGSVSCLLVPDLTSGNIVGGDAGAFYAAVVPHEAEAKVTASATHEVASSAQLILQRYEWPEP